MQRQPSPAAVWPIVSIPWILHGIAYADEMVTFAPAGKPVGWPEALVQAFFESTGCWIVLSVLLVETVRRVSLAAPARRRGLATIAFAVVAVIVLRAVYVRVAYPLFAEFLAGMPTIPSFADILARSFRLHTLRVSLIAGVAAVWFHLRGASSNEARIAALTARLARARADAPAASLDPGFLFDALGAIAARINTDADGADRLLVALAALLRRNLDGPGCEITVGEDAALAGQFAQIESVRLGRRIDIDVAIAPDCTGAIVPALTLTTLTAQMIAHDPARPVHIAITRADDATLRIDVDGNAGNDALATIAARLLGLYGERVALTRPAAGGIRVALPLRGSAT
jgi:hypothetical protein